MVDYYKILGVSRKASQKEIEDAYRAIVRENHPDLYPNDKARAERLALANQAYQTLRDPEKRQQYDAQFEEVSRGGRFAKSRSSSSPSTTGTRNPFSEVLDAMITSRQSPNTTAKPVSQYTLWVSEAEARNGGVKRVTIGDQIVLVPIRPGSKDRDIVQIPVVIRISK